MNKLAHRTSPSAGGGDALAADWPAARARWTGTLRAGLLVGYLVLVAVMWKRNGIPLERLQVLGWVAGALLIATTGRPNGGPVAMLRDWLPIGLVLAAYDLSRGMADTLGMPVQMSSLVKAEKLLALGHIPTVVAQRYLGPYTGPARWWEIPVSMSYLSHFVVPFAVMAVLWATRREQFRRYRNMLLVLTALGLATYLLLPAAPPWMASRNDLIGPVQRVGLRGMEAFGLETADAMVRYGARFGNAVAALPSLHAGWSTLTAIWFAREARRRWWPLLFAYPAIMGVSLVISGEHYVVDVLLGYLYAAAAVWLVLRAERWCRTRRQRVPGVVAGGASPPAEPQSPTLAGAGRVGQADGRG